MNKQDSSEEREYLTSLLKDFPIEPSINADFAIAQMQTRYSVVLKQSKFFGDILMNADSIKSSNLKASDIPNIIHKYLYQGILSNAGEFRHLDEPKEGAVRFGRNSEFVGMHPPHIVNAIKVACAPLEKESTEPIWNAAKFYQRFVQIHPFYDANGRIGRAIVTAYLNHYELYMNWENLERNNRWIGLLNHCHKCYSHSGYDDALTRHTKYWEKSIGSGNFRTDEF